VMRLEALSTSHRAPIDPFANDVPELVVYLRRWALVHQERDRLGRTWVGVDDSSELVGFFTLSAASLDRSTVTEGDLARLPRFPVPGILLARLAVDQRVQGQGVGTWLFDQALTKTLQLAIDGPIGFRVLIADAKNAAAAGFYARRGMIALSATAWPRRMVLDLKPIIGGTPT
jgi:GNAT superfamily N-acetyltransferase